MRRLLRHIPNTITSLNLVSGTAAIFFALRGNLTEAALLICIAAVFDFLDGVAARLLKAYSEIGKELDSLADMVSFGLAPTAILFSLIELSLFGSQSGEWGALAVWLKIATLLPVFLMPVMSGLRLAKFNVMQSDETYFLGLPTPSNGLIWASLGLIFELTAGNGITHIVFSTYVLVVVGLLTSGMLVMNLPMFSLKFKSLKLSENWYRYLFLFLAFVFIVVLPLYGLTLTMFTYIILNLVFYIFKIKY